MFAEFYNEIIENNCLLTSRPSLSAILLETDFHNMFYFQRMSDQSVIMTQYQYLDEHLEE